MKKTVFTLDIGNFAPEITRITFPLMKRYAHKIGAEFHIIKQRKFPGWPIPVEKLQIFELGQEMHNEWNIFLDADAIVHPELFDLTDHIDRDTVLHHGRDMAGLRFRADRFFRRDGRNIGCCNWCTMASAWCIDLWAPPTDITLPEAVDAIYPTVNEQASGVIEPAHLVDDYLLSRNVARFGLKLTTVPEVNKRIGLEGSNFFWHQYTLSIEQKTRLIYNILPRSPGWGFLKPMLGEKERNAMRTAVIDQQGVVQNVIVANAGFGTDCVPIPEGMPVGVGWTYLNGQFAPPPSPPAEPVEPANDEHSGE